MKTLDLNLNNLIIVAVVFLVSTILNVTYSQEFIPGEIYYDSTGYVEYRAGNLPIVMSVPHGGYLRPTSIPDRDCPGCVYLSDAYTQEISDGMYNEFVTETGCYPHVIINLLDRVKFDANRDIGDAADGNPTVEIAWQNYHDFIDTAGMQISNDYGKGIFLDIHGQSHPIQRIEFGYLMTENDLRLTDAQLDTSPFVEKSSIRSLVGNNIQGLSHSKLLRGTESFGSLMNDKGFPSVPSITDPFPAVGDPYFDGGYNVGRHGSSDGNGTIDAIMIELNRDIRMDPTSRALLISALRTSANEYIDFHYNSEYTGNYCGLIGITEHSQPFTTEIFVFPNPSNGLLALRVENAKSGFTSKVEVYDLIGKRVYENVLEFSEGTSTSEINLQHLAKGSYILMLKSKNVTKTLGFIISD